MSQSPHTPTEALASNRYSLLATVNPFAAPHSCILEKTTLLLSTFGAMPKVFSNSVTKSNWTLSANAAGIASCGHLFRLPYTGVDKSVISRMEFISSFFFFFNVLFPIYAKLSFSITCAPSNASNFCFVSSSKFPIATLADQILLKTNSRFLYRASLVLIPKLAFSALKILGLSFFFSALLFTAVFIKLNAHLPLCAMTTKSYSPNSL